jgi:hypothetical protein
MTEELQCKVESKPVIKSKLNWLGFIMVLLAAITNPSFEIVFGDKIPQAWLSPIMFVCGWLVIAFRTLGTSMPVTMNWKMPWGN